MTRPKVRFDVRDRAGVITFDAPPLNLIDRQLRAESQVVSRSRQTTPLTASSCAAPAVY